MGEKARMLFSLERMSERSLTERECIVSSTKQAVHSQTSQILQEPIEIF